MWTLSVVESNPGSIDEVELVDTEAEEVIQAFSFERANERFAKGIGLRCLDGCLDAADLLGFPKLLEVIRKFTVSVMNEEAGIKAFIVQPHGSVATLLHDPWRVWMQGRRGAVDLPAADVDEDQAIGSVGTTKGVDFLGKVIGRN